MNQFKADMLTRLRNDNASIAVVGLGYVGWPLLKLLSGQYSVIGYDIDIDKVNILKKRVADKIRITHNIDDLRGAEIFIICVPTDVHKDQSPDLSALIAASEDIGRLLQPGNVVIYESTVYPGCTEEVCIPVLQSCSGYQLNKDFWVGYAPERVVPGVAEKTIEEVPRVVGGSDEACTMFLVQFYATFVHAPIHRTSSIKVAEASKIVENIQRDLNISLMNELSIIFDKMNIDTQEVLDAAKTKWNFHPYYPGLVGGHCISVDPFYLLFKSRQLGIEPNVIAAGRAINEYLPLYISQKIEDILTDHGKSIVRSRILVLGATFKENIDDIRNSKVLDLIRHLQEGNAEIEVFDPHISPEKALINKIPLIAEPGKNDSYDVLIIAVKHKVFCELPVTYFQGLLNEPKILFDLKRVIPASERKNFAYWAL